jgi:hypothetical protein
MVLGEACQLASHWYDFNRTIDWMNCPPLWPTLRYHLSFGEHQRCCRKFSNVATRSIAHFIPGISSHRSRWVLQMKVPGPGCMARRMNAVPTVALTPPNVRVTTVRSDNASSASVPTQSLSYFEVGGELQEIFVKEWVVPVCSFKYLSTHHHSQQGLKV